MQAGPGGPSLDVVLDIGPETYSVTAEVGSEVERQKIPQPTNKIGETRIRQRAISVLSQAGGEETGLNVQKTSPTMGQIVVRGLTGKNVVNYVDGVRYTTGAQRGGVNTFFNLNDASNLQAIEVVRGPSSAQYGSDSLAGTVNLLTKVPEFGFEKGRFNGEIMPFFSSANRSFGSNVMVGYGNEKFGGYVNIFGRRINTLRTPGRPRFSFGRYTLSGPALERTLRPQSRHRVYAIRRRHPA